MPAAFAQHFSVGIAAGAGLTNAFDDQTFQGLNSSIRYFSDSKDLIVGPTFELHLPLGFSVEADALYRGLSLANSTLITVAPGTGTSSKTVASWEFPILGKYRLLATPLLKPFVEAGPSFRHVGSVDNASLSGKGFALGGGVDAHLWKLHISPEIRYTRWGSDSTSQLLQLPKSNINQAEFLVGFSF